MATAFGSHAVVGAQALDGLWVSRQWHGPAVRGELSVECRQLACTADIAGRGVPFTVTDGQWVFSLPDGEGSFRGRRVGSRLEGHWIQSPVSVWSVRHATPLTLVPDGPSRWRGVVAPAEETSTFFLHVRDGRPLLRQPEQNLGRLFRMERIAATGSAVQVTGRQGKVIAQGTWDASARRLAIDLGEQGGWVEFRRASPTDERQFRGDPAPWVEGAPRAGRDGWPVAAPADVGLDAGMLSALADHVARLPAEAPDGLQTHAILIARHGKLVFERYFRGSHAGELHDTRSATKVLAQLLAGAAGIPASTPVRDGITLGHLLSMSSGLDCDDEDDKSPGNEDRVQEQHANEDWTRLTLALPAVRAPGERATYCSMGANLAGATVARATGRWLPDLFRETIGQPMQFGHYAWNLTPTGDAYTGGGARLVPRDFLKLAQLMLDGGQWKGRRILPDAWVRESLTARFEMHGHGYGYLWWSASYPYQGRQVQAWFAAGNGGQIAMLVPELGLALAFLGGNYGSAASLVPQRELVPRFVLPAVTSR